MRIDELIMLWENPWSCRIESISGTRAIGAVSGGSWSTIVDRERNKRITDGANAHLMSFLRCADFERGRGELELNPQMNERRLHYIRDLSFILPARLHSQPEALLVFLTGHCFPVNHILIFWYLRPIVLDSSTLCINVPVIVIVPVRFGSRRPDLLLFNLRFLITATTPRTMGDYRRASGSFESLFLHRI